VADEDVDEEADARLLIATVGANLVSRAGAIPGRDTAV